MLMQMGLSLLKWEQVGMPVGSLRRIKDEGLSGRCIIIHDQ